MNDPKLDILIRLSKEFSVRQIRYAVGASCLLYLHGLSDVFHDIDLLVVREDFPKASSCLREMGTALPSEAYSGYYGKFLVGGVEIDLIGEFLFHKENEVIDRSYKADERPEILYVNGHPVSCEPLEKWLVDYELMGRTLKHELLKEYFRGRPVLVKYVLRDAEWPYFLETILETYPYPFVTKERLEALKCDPEIDLYTVYGSCKELLCVYPLSEDRYAEVTLFLTNDGDSTEAFLEEIVKRYPDLSVDVVYPPDNGMITKALEKRGASFEPVQHEMINTVLPKEPSLKATPYDPVYEEGYREIHQDDDRYWTADRVLAEESFDVYLIIDEGQPAAYLDLMRGTKKDMVYDLFVIKEKRGRGYGSALIAEASRSSGQENLILTVDEDNETALRIYKAAGFTVVQGKDTRTAHYIRKDK